MRYTGSDNPGSLLEHVLRRRVGFIICAIFEAHPIIMRHFYVR